MYSSSVPLTVSQRQVCPHTNLKIGRQPLEVRAPHTLHVKIKKAKMKINPHAIVVPFIVLVDPAQCPNKSSFENDNADVYYYYVISGSHLAEAIKQLV